MRYLVARSSVPPKLVTDWDDPTWQCAATIDIAHFHPRGSDHRPRTCARVLYDARNLYVIFDVQLAVDWKPGSYVNIPVSPYNLRMSITSGPIVPGITGYSTVLPGA
jgi:hypothetical protein